MCLYNTARCLTHNLCNRMLRRVTTAKTTRILT